MSPQLTKNLLNFGFMFRNVFSNLSALITLVLRLRYLNLPQRMSANLSLNLFSHKVFWNKNYWRELDSSHIWYLSGITISQAEFMEAREECRSDSQNLGVELTGSGHCRSPRQKNDSLCSLRERKNRWEGNLTFFCFVFRINFHFLCPDPENRWNNYSRLGMPQFSVWNRIGASRQHASIFTLKGSN